MKEYLIRKWREEGIDKKVIDAFIKIPREEFVLNKKEAYEDRPLPILAGQTISQPTTIMIMTQALDVKKGMKVLEVGCGSGYQAAILSKLVGSKGKIISVEIIEELVKFARCNLKKVGIKNVEIIHGDGSLGYEKEAPYDRIIVTAGASEIPKPLIKQLKVNGVLVIPVGPSYCQNMMVVKKKAKNKIVIKNIGDFVFVDLKGKLGRKDDSLS